MTSRMRTWLLGGLLCGMVTPGGTGRAEPTLSPPARFRIGAILPLSGIAASAGQEARRGIELGIAQAELRGISLAVSFEDDRMPEQHLVVGAAHKLLTVDKIQAGLTLVTEESRPIGPIFNQNQVPLLILWDSNQSTKSSGQFVFSNGYSTEQAAERMASFARKRLGLSRIAIIAHQDPWTEILATSFAAEFERQGGSVVYQEEVNPAVSDFRVQVTKLKQSAPEGVYLPLIPPPLVDLLKQLEQQQVAIVRMTGDGFIPEFISAAGSAAEGVYLTNGSYGDNGSLQDLYRTRYGTDPSGPEYVECGYSAVLRLTEALVKANKENLNLQQSLAALFGPAHSADRIQSVYQIKKGVRVLVE